MAKIYNRGSNDFTHIGVPFNYTRGNPLPLDNSSIWNTKAEAEDYAKNNPVAYVGQILTVVEDDKTSVWKIVDEAGTLEPVDSAKNSYDVIQKLDDYLYYLEYNGELDAAGAKAYIEKMWKHIPEDTPSFMVQSPGHRGGGCSVVRSGNLVGRNLDWNYSHMCDFVIRIPAKDGRHAVLGVAGDRPELCEAEVSKGEYSPVYNYLPFLLLDGINDAGLFVELNVVPAGDYGLTKGTHPGAAEELCQSQIPSYALMNFDNAYAAASHIAEHVNVYARFPEGEPPIEIHVLFADKEHTYVLEFVDNVAHVICVDDHPWMTNFYLKGVTFNEDRTVSYKGSGLTSHAAGVERWNLIAGRQDGVGTPSRMLGLMATNLLYTNAYRTFTNPVWYSEFTGIYPEPYGELTIDMIEDDVGAYSQILTDCRTLYERRTRDNPITWQTVHTSIYDLDKLDLTIVHQEKVVRHSRHFPFYKDGVPTPCPLLLQTWKISSAAESLDGIEMVPGKVDETHYGWVKDGVKLYYANGRWNFTTPDGVTSAIGSSGVSCITLSDFPYAGQITVLKTGDKDDKTALCATQAYVDAAVLVETQRAQAAENALLLKIQEKVSAEVSEPIESLFLRKG